jgi:hypothetical protein
MRRFGEVSLGIEDGSARCVRSADWHSSLTGLQGGLQVG